MPPFVLIVLKVVFLGLLYLFVYRAIRSAALDVRGARTIAARAPASPAETRTARRPTNAPRSLVLFDERGAQGETHRLDGRSLQIGRADDCDVRVADTYVSSRHARLYQRDGAWYVEDLGSTNGTYVNRSRVSAPEEVHAGDRVRLGRTTLELRR